MNCSVLEDFWGGGVDHIYLICFRPTASALSLHLNYSFPSLPLKINHLTQVKIKDHIKYYLISYLNIEI